MNHSRTFSRRATLASPAGAALAGTATIRASASERRGRYRRSVRFATNADPYEGDSYDHVVRQFLDHPAINLPAKPPAGAGGAEAAKLQGGANLGRLGDPAYDTADFSDTTPGNPRVDHVLPSKGPLPGRNGVFWPTADDPLHRLVGDGTTVVTSDHRMVWQDVRPA